MTFDKWWEKNGQSYYVSVPHPKKGIFVNMARDAWNAACDACMVQEPLFEVAGFFKKTESGWIEIDDREASDAALAGDESVCFLYREAASPAPQRREGEL